MVDTLNFRNAEFIFSLSASSDMYSVCGVDDQIGPVTVLEGHITVQCIGEIIYILVF